MNVEFLIIAFPATFYIEFVYIYYYIEINLKKFLHSSIKNGENPPFIYDIYFIFYPSCERRDSI